jgi:hypothetical protein
MQLQFNEWSCPPERLHHDDKHELYNLVCTTTKQFELQRACNYVNLYGSDVTTNMDWMKQATKIKHTSGNNFRAISMYITICISNIEIGWINPELMWICRTAH